jgi:Protein of unknown function (DUF2442)
MSILAAEYERSALIERVNIDAEWVSVDLSDGRRISTPLSWYPRLQSASPAARRNFRLIGGGEGIHWPEVDEDLSLDGMLAGRRAVSA